MRNYRATDDETDRGGTVSATDCDVAIIGAGPYGLAAAAHLHAANGLDIRVFGDPMSFWHEQMPRGMVLRSPYVASNIADPERELTLDGYQELTKQQLPRPVALEQFAVDRALVWIAEIAAVWMAQTLDEAEAPLDRKRLLEPRLDRPLAEHGEQRVILRQRVRQLDDPSERERPEAATAPGLRLVRIRMRDRAVVLHGQLGEPFDDAMSAR